MNDDINNNEDSDEDIEYDDEEFDINDEEEEDNEDNEEPLDDLKKQLEVKKKARDDLSKEIAALQLKISNRKGKICQFRTHFFYFFRDTIDAKLIFLAFQSLVFDQF